MKKQISVLRHSSESWNPGAGLEFWIPAFAGMTGQGNFVRISLFFFLLFCSFFLLSTATYADTPYMPQTPGPTGQTTPTSSDAFTQLITTNTTQGMQIFQNVSQQNMLNNNADFLQEDSHSTPHLKIDGGSSEHTETPGE